MDRILQQRIHNMRLDVLHFLATLAVTDSFALELSEISHSTSTPEANLRGVISALRRVKIGGEPLIKSAGKDNDGRFRWRINEDVVDKKELAEFLDREVLGKKGF